MPEIQIKDKLITLEELGAAYNNITPANIGAAYMTRTLYPPHPVGTTNQSELIANFDYIIGQAPADEKYFCGIANYAGNCIFWGYSYPPDENDGIRKYADLHYIAVNGHYYHAEKSGGIWAIQDLTVMATDHGGTGATTPADARANLQAENTIVTNYSTSDFTTVYLQPYDGRLRAVKKGSMVHLFYAVFNGYSANTPTNLFILPSALCPISPQNGIPITVTDGNTTVIGYGYADINSSGLVLMNVNAVGHAQLCVTYIA